MASFDAFCQPREASMMQNAQVSPLGIHAHCAPSRSAFFTVVSTPARLTSLPTADPIVSAEAFCLIMPLTVLATSPYVAVSAGTAAGRRTPSSFAIASYISHAAAAALSPYVLASA